MRSNISVGLRVSDAIGDMLTSGRQCGQRGRREAPDIQRRRRIENGVSVSRNSKGKEQSDAAWFQSACAHGLKR
jgi:hypothetical protein